MFRTSPVVAEDEWTLDLTVEGHIAVLSLNNPDKLNAWSWESTRQLGARADQIRFDDRVRVVVFAVKVGPSVQGSTSACPRTG